MRVLQNVFLMFYFRNITWQDICLNLPGVLYHVLIAWEKETLSSADVKNILDNIKRRMFSFSVCAASFLSAYMHSVKEVTQTN